MNNLNSVRNFVLLPNGFFFSPIGSSYFCGRYRGEDFPPQPIAIDLPFPFDRLFVDYYRGELRVNHELVPYRYSHLSTPQLPLHLGGESHERLGRFENIEYMEVRDGVLSANGLVKPLRYFPLDRFEMSLLDIARANQFLAWGFRSVEFVYAWYRRVFFLEFNENWMTFYLRVGYHLDIDNA
jgi:hypothetical protein